MIHIISGKYKRKPICVIGRTRPPLQRIREWIFSVLSNYVDFENSTVLDLFAGTGSFGLECISRGAKNVYFVEENVSTVNELLRKFKDWNIENGKILRMNAAYLPKCQDEPNLIFIDPPFGHKMPAKILNILFKKGWAKNAVVMLRCETLFDDSRLEFLNMNCIGISNIYIARAKNED